MARWAGGRGRHIGTVAAGLVVALPALRTRGVNLTVVTLGLGYTISEVVLANPQWANSPTARARRSATWTCSGSSGTRPNTRIGGRCVSGRITRGRVVVANLRRSRTGQRLLAVRTNERAAASLGISVVAVKLYAFGVAAASRRSRCPRRGSGAT